MKNEPTFISASDEITVIADRLSAILANEPDLAAADLDKLLGTFPAALRRIFARDDLGQTSRAALRDELSYLSVGDWASLTSAMTPETLANLIVALPIWDTDRDLPERELILSISDIMTAIEAQHLYKFAVRITKLV